MAATDTSYDDRMGHDWMRNILNFAARFEDEGVLGIAQDTVAHTTNIAVSVVSAATTAALHALSEASANVGGLLTGDTTDQSDYTNVARYSPEDDNLAKLNDSANSFVSKTAQIMMGAISPLLVYDESAIKNQIQTQWVPEENLIKADCETKSLSRFYDAEFSDADFHDADFCVANTCDESVYYDAASSSTTNSTAGSTSLLPMEDSRNDQPVPTSVVVLKESKRYYWDISGMISETDRGIIPPISLKDNYYVVSDNVGCTESLNHVLDILVERSLSIAVAASAELCWNPDDRTKEILERHSKDSTEEWVDMLECEVLKWTGSLPKNLNSKCDMPMLKTRGVVNMTPFDLKELLLDCDRVQLFNKNSLGKEDICPLPNIQTGEAKIVKNVIKIPIVGGAIQTLSLTHSRSIENGGFVIVSQSVKEQRRETISNPFYLISILRPVPNSDKTELTNIAQTSSFPIPKFLMRKVGFMGAIDFFKNVRDLSI